MNDSLFNSLRESQLQWLPELGVGWYPVTDSPYDDAYWERYLAMDATSTGEGLTEDRCNWVKSFWRGPVCDIGIGGGRFVREHGQATGFDINPRARDWLRGQCLYRDPTFGVEAATFWDSLEHIHDPTDILLGVKNWVFASLPIFNGPEHVLRSKHFRRDEHCWYFTDAGLVRFMDRHGFVLAGCCDMEQYWGREDIRTYAFCRRGVAR